MEDLGWWLARTLGVTGRDNETVRRAVERGLQLDAALRTPAVAYAARVEQVLERQVQQQRRWRVLPWVLLIGGVLAVTVLRELNGFVVLWLGQSLVYAFVIPRAQRRRLARVRRAREVNSEPSAVA